MYKSVSWTWSQGECNLHHSIYHPSPSLHQAFILQKNHQTPPSAWPLSIFLPSFLTPPPCLHYTSGSIPALEWKKSLVAQRNCQFRIKEFLVEEPTTGVLSSTSTQPNCCCSTSKSPWINPTYSTTVSAVLLASLHGPFLHLHQWPNPSAAASLVAPPDFLNQY